ncbi:MAG TPA: 2-phospho-L-lactate transferase [Methanomicrobiales archaeon]|jgi:LPPG:FO 2-phospho-L-lactate transferase|nr:2-phospho-L-lactate transferase [Methanomicrobiales archaeon]
MITFLSGGTGTPKLLRGMRSHLPDRDIAVVVNTAEDVWISGNHLSPDFDTVMYLFAGLADTQSWWGIAGDSFATHDALVGWGGEEPLEIGDRDRAIHILRGELLRKGMRLTEASALIARRLGVEAVLLPMADTPVATLLDTDLGLLHFQDYWVKHRGKPRVKEVMRRFPEPPKATPEVLRAIGEAEGVVIGPSNPVTSIAPILECTGVPEALAGKFVVAVSPFIGDRPVSGPAAELMRAWGREPDSRGTFALYEDIADIIIQDIRDPVKVGGAVQLDTLMRDKPVAEALAGEILTLLRGKSS